MLVGWSSSGTRPEFDVVTGISTGALSAPFAFLGSDWDDELRAAYTEGQTQQMLSWRRLNAFNTPSLYSSSTLEGLVRENVTAELLASIAVEHAKGRRLLVATTNLDSQETVIWDMGLLATQGGSEALELFRQILVASASIPGVFPPVMIAGLDGQNRIVSEMHVDGGVNAPFLAIPESLLLQQGEVRGDATLTLYVLVNGQIVPTRSTTPGNLPSILARTYDSMSKASLRTSLIATAAFARRNQVRLQVSGIPSDVSASSLDFASESMNTLFEYGFTRASEGSAWSALDRVLERGDATHPADDVDPTDLSESNP